MQQIKAPVGEDDALALPLQLVYLQIRLFKRKDFLNTHGHQFPHQDSKNYMPVNSKSAVGS
jgi:hypothetical protein